MYFLNVQCKDKEPNIIIIKLFFFFGQVVKTIKRQVNINLFSRKMCSLFCGKLNIVLYKIYIYV